MGFCPSGRRARTLVPLFLFLTGLLVSSSASQDDEANKVHPRLDKYKASRRLPPKPDKPGNGNGNGNGNGFNKKPTSGSRLVGCTTLVLASFPAHCKAFVPGGPGCNFDFRQHGVRELYDCDAVASLHATSYIDTPPQGLTPIGRLDYTFDNQLNGKGGSLSGSFAVSAMDASCGTAEYVGRINLHPQRGSTVYGFKWVKGVYSLATGLIKAASPKGLTIATGGFIRQGTKDAPSGYSVLAIKVVLSYGMPGPSLPIACDTQLLRRVFSVPAPSNVNERVALDETIRNAKHWAVEILNELRHLDRKKVSTGVVSHTSIQILNKGGIHHTPPVQGTVHPHKTLLVQGGLTYFLAELVERLKSNQ